MAESINRYESLIHLAVEDYAAANQATEKRGRLEEKLAEVSRQEEALRDRADMYRGSIQNHAFRASDSYGRITREPGLEYLRAMYQVSGVSSEQYEASTELWRTLLIPGLTATPVLIKSENEARLFISQAGTAVGSALTFEKSSDVGLVQIQIHSQTPGAQFKRSESGWQTVDSTIQRTVIQIDDTEMTADPDRSQEAMREDSEVAKKNTLIAVGKKAVEVALDMFSIESLEGPIPTPNEVDGLVMKGLLNELQGDSHSSREILSSTVKVSPEDYRVLYRTTLSSFIKVNSSQGYFSNITALPIILHGDLGKVLNITKTYRDDAILDAIYETETRESAEPGGEILNAYRLQRYYEVEENPLSGVKAAAEAVVGDILSNPILTGIKDRQVLSSAAPRDKFLQAQIARRQLKRLEDFDARSFSKWKEKKALRKIVQGAS